MFPVLLHPSNPPKSLTFELRPFELLTFTFFFLLTLHLSLFLYGHPDFPLLAAHPYDGFIVTSRRCLDADHLMSSITRTPILRLDLSPCPPRPGDERLDLSVGKHNKFSGYKFLSPSLTLLLCLCCLY